MAQFIQAFLRIGEDYIRSDSIVGITIQEKDFTGEKVENSRTYRLATIRLASGQSYEYKDAATVQLISDWVKPRSKPLVPDVE